ASGAVPEGTADGAPGPRAVGGEEGGGPRERKQLFLRADKDMGALGALGPAEEIDPPALGLEVIEQKPHPLEILECLEIVEQVSGAAHDQLALVRFPAGPAREAGCDD